MWIERLPSVAPSAGALAAARALIEVLQEVAGAAAEGWTGVPEDAADVAVQAAVLENEALAVAHPVVPLSYGPPPSTLQYVFDPGLCPGPLI